MNRVAIAEVTVFVLSRHASSRAAERDVSRLEIVLVWAYGWSFSTAKGIKRVLWGVGRPDAVTPAEWERAKSVVLVLAGDLIKTIYREGGR